MLDAHDDRGRPIRVLVAADGEKVRLEVEGSISTNVARFDPADAQRIGRALQSMASKVARA